MWRFFHISVSLLTWMPVVGFSIVTLAVLHAQDMDSSRTPVRFTGEVKAGETYSVDFDDRFCFQLLPSPYGWLVVITDERKTEDISRLTPPWHFVPNPREIEGWHFRNADNTRPNSAGDKNVNAPGNVREFIFSPQVGRTLGDPEAKAPVSPEEIHSIMDFGTGRLIITGYELTNLQKGERASFRWMHFIVELSWPRAGQVEQRE